jgi:hypothetical protein
MTTLPPLSLNDEQLELVRNAAEPIRHGLRGFYLEALANELAREKTPLTNAALHRPVAVAQRAVIASTGHQTNKGATIKGSERANLVGFTPESRPTGR